MQHAPKAIEIDTRRGAFRRDINGLRAWAVVVVMLFHFGVPGFGGGFVGVDVFFVISGFLMTQIIAKGLETSAALGSLSPVIASEVKQSRAAPPVSAAAGSPRRSAPRDDGFPVIARPSPVIASAAKQSSNDASNILAAGLSRRAAPRDDGAGHASRSAGFSIWGFYLARARRIVPALLVLCAVLLALGWFVLPAPDYRPLGIHVLTSVLFASNIQYWREAGYFDAASHDKWLLHTWSLSVEWQFYLVLPLLLWGVWRWWPGRRNAARVLAVGLVVSLGLSAWLTASKPEAAFFLLPTRAWEMLAGGLVALWGGRISTGRFISAIGTLRGRRVLEGLGAAMVALAVVTANPARWPGLAAVLPVLGTALVLLAARQDSPLTAPALFQRLGDWSYSIYLWHWPVAVALTYLGWQGQPGPVLAGLALSLLLGWASYRWAEPLGRRHLARWRTWPALATVAVASLAVAVPALAVRQMQGMPGRLSAQVEAIAAGALDANPRREQSHSMGGRDFKKAVYGGPDIRAIVLGDSHASAIVTAVQAALPSPGQGVLGMSYTGCPTLFGVRQERQDLHCAEFNEWAMQQMAALPPSVPVIIANRGSAYLYGNAYGAHTPQPAVFFDRPLRAPDNAEPSAAMANEVKQSSFAPPSGAATGSPRRSAPHDDSNASLITNPALREYANHLAAAACRIAQTRPVYLLRPLPEMPADVPRTLARAAQLGRPLDMAMPLTVYRQRNAVIWAAQDRAQAECGVHILDPLPALCTDGACPAIDGLAPRYYDDNHLTEAGGRLLVNLFRQIGH